MLEINLLKPMFSAKDMRQIKRIRAMDEARKNPNLSVCKHNNCSNMFYNYYANEYPAGRIVDDPSRKKQLCPDCAARNYMKRIETNPELFAPPLSYDDELRAGFKLLKSAYASDAPPAGPRCAYRATVCDIQGRTYTTVFVD